MEKNIQVINPEEIGGNLHEVKKIRKVKDKHGREGYTMLMWDGIYIRGWKTVTDFASGWPQDQRDLLEAAAD